jgi:hypothetical protein
MLSLLHAVYVLIALGLLGWAALRYRVVRRLELIGVILLLAGLMYDNGVVAIGSTLGIGQNLEWLSGLRYYAHILGTPCLMLGTLWLCQWAGLAWANQRWVVGGIWGLTAVMIVVGFVQFATGHLKPVCQQDTLRYTERITTALMCENVDYAAYGVQFNADGSVQAERSLPPIPSFVTIGVLIVQGIAMGRAIGWWALLAGAVVMFIGGAVPASVIGLWVANAAEFVLLTCVILTVDHLAQRKPLLTV